MGVGGNDVPKNAPLTLMKYKCFLCGIPKARKTCKTMHSKKRQSFLKRDPERSPTFPALFYVLSLFCSRFHYVYLKNVKYLNPLAWAMNHLDLDRKKKNRFIGSVQHIIFKFKTSGVKELKWNILKDNQAWDFYPKKSIRTPAWFHLIQGYKDT